MEWETAKLKIQQKKLEDAYVSSLESESFVVKAYTTKYSVSSFRLPKLDEALLRSIENMRNGNGRGDSNEPKSRATKSPSAGTEEQ